MFITERLCGVFLYIVVLLFFCYMLFVEKRNHYFRILFAYCIVLAIMAYFFIPISDSDISRWAPIIDQWTRLPLNEMAKYSFQMSSTPLAYLYMYALGRLGGYKLVMAITALLTYGNVFYILGHYAASKKIPGIDVAITLFFYMAGGIFIDVISDVRYMIAFSFLALSIYRENFCKQKKIISFIFYLVAALFHLTAWAVILIRIIGLVLNRAVSMRNRIISILVIVIVTVIVYSRISGYLLSAYNKLESYLTIQHYSYIWEFIISLLIICTLLIVLRKSSYHRYIKREYLELYKLFLFFSIISIIEFNMFHRMTALDAIISMPVILEYLSHSNTIIRKRNLVIISLFVLLVACSRGHLCSYKFFIL